MSDKQKYYTNTFPSPIAPDDVKKDQEYGLAVGKAIWNTAIMGNTSYYSIRNLKFAENRIFANGKQPFQTYLSLMGVDAKIASLILIIILDLLLLNSEISW